MIRNPRYISIRIQETWDRIQYIWVRIQDICVRIQDIWVRIQDKGDRIQDIWVRIQDKGDIIQDIWVRIQELWVRIQDIWVRIQELWVRHQDVILHELGVCTLWVSLPEPWGSQCGFQNMPSSGWMLSPEVWISSPEMFSWGWGNPWETAGDLQQTRQTQQGGLQTPHQEEDSVL